MSAAKEEFVTPSGRLLHGSVFQGTRKGFGGKDNPLGEDGKPKLRYEMGVAFPKTDPLAVELITKIWKVAREAWPAQFDANGAPLRADFAFKYVDGDSAVPNLKLKVPNQQPNYPGHYIVWFRTDYAPDVVDAQGRPLVDPASVKRGFWVRIGGTVAASGEVSGDGKPGVFINPNGIQLCGHDEVITSGPDLAAMFSDPIVLPQGVSATPLAPTGAMPAPAGVATPPAVPGPATPPAAPQPPVTAPAAPQTFPATAPVPAAPVPAAPTPPAPTPPAPTPPAPAAPTGPQMVAGCPHTYASLKAQNWTDAQMVHAGFLPPPLDDDIPF